MAKYHVHVYNITAMQEIEVEASNDQEARQMALEEADIRPEWKKPDTNMMAVSFMEGERQGETD